MLRRWRQLAPLLLLFASLPLLYRIWTPIHGYVRDLDYDPKRLRISILTGARIRNPTSLEWGPEGRLYVATREGLIHRLQVRRDGSGDYHVRTDEPIRAIQEIANHDDFGRSAPEVDTRLVTGILLAGTAENPVIYASSSDPRIGNPSIDTNSGVVSRLDYAGGQWSRKDLVRGLPRSRYDHAPHGLALDRARNLLYVSVGANTNAGLPSKDFFNLPDYALSGTILEVDLRRLGDTTYDLPTLDDPDRPSSRDEGDPFGGNGGRNQAYVSPNGPVRIHTTGLRNAYDLALAGNVIYTVDNGANEGFGPIADPAGPKEPPHEPNALHRIASAGVYLGHPNLYRARTDPRQAHYLPPGKANGALDVFPKSTNGLALAGARLLAISLDNQLYSLDLNSDAKTGMRQRVLVSNLGVMPLDVCVRADGVIWIADFGDDKIYVIERQNPSTWTLGRRLEAGVESLRLFMRPAVLPVMDFIQQHYANLRSRPARR
jgi:hypothetical protein